MFQLELDTLGTKNFEIGTVVKKLQMFEVGQILKKILTFFFGKYILQKSWKCNLSFIDEKFMRIRIFFVANFFLDKKNWFTRARIFLL